MSQEYLAKINEEYDRVGRELAAGKDNSAETIQKAYDNISVTLAKFRAEQEKALNTYVGRLYEERYNMQDQQEKLALGISRISPSAVFTLAAFELCQTSLELRNNYRDKLAAYSADYSDFINKKQADNQGETQGSRTVNPAEIPDFVYQSNELSVILQKVLPDMAILLLFNLVFFSGAFVAFLRYDLR
jgi:hypothetical protein